jgi:hypothetical protein
MCSHRAASLQLTVSRERLTFCSALAWSVGAFTSRETQKGLAIDFWLSNQCVKFERPALGGLRANQKLAGTLPVR